MCKIVVFYLQSVFQVFPWSAKGKIMLNFKMYVAVINCLDKFFFRVKSNSYILSCISTVEAFRKYLHLIETFVVLQCLEVML